MNKEAVQICNSSSKQHAIRALSSDEEEGFVSPPNKIHKSSDTKKLSPPEYFSYPEDIDKCISTLKSMAGSSSNSDLYLTVDDSYFSALHDDDEIFPISDEKYAEELQLQEALMFSSSSSPISSSSSPISSTSSSSKQPLLTSSTSEPASKSTVSFLCGICMDTKTTSEMFHNTKVCGHTFCSDCIREHVAAKIEENLTMITCPDPGCNALIGPDVCTDIVPNQVLERWDKILCESLITESHKFYCPFKDCSAMLVDDGEVAVTSSECPNCNRLFCAQCKVTWHSEMNCIEYQSLKKGVKSPDEIFPISDEKYAEELQLQALMFSSSTSPISSSSSPSPISSASSSSKQPLLTSSTSEPASKSTITFFCGICMDTKTTSEMFHNTKVCGHTFCSDCIREHVAAKIKENLTMITCPDPGCNAMIGPDVCTDIVPNQVLERWDKILCESLITESHKFYCPFKDCSAMLVDDGEVAVTSSECPNCNRLFCAQCKVTWHSEMNCSEYQSLKKGVKSPDEILFMDLAMEKKWMKCAKCNFYVEKKEGCHHISCRCGHHFCYQCGRAKSNPSHHSCACGA